MFFFPRLAKGLDDFESEEEQVPETNKDAPYILQPDSLDQCQVLVSPMDQAQMDLPRKIHWEVNVVLNTDGFTDYTITGVNKTTSEQVRPRYVRNVLKSGKAKPFGCLDFSKTYFS